MLTCEETLKYLAAYADSELDNRLNLDMEDHLTSCLQCREELQGIRALKAAVRQQLPRPEVPRALRTQIETAVCSSSLRRFRQVLMSRRVWTAVAALIVLAVGAFYYLGNIPSRGMVPVYAAVMTSEHNNCWRKGWISFQESDPEKLADKLYVRLGYPIDLHEVSLDGKTVVGGSICSFLGRKGAHIFLQDSNHRYSYYVFRGEGLAPPSGRKCLSATGRKLLVDSKNGDSLVTWQEGGFYHALVTDAPESAAQNMVL